MTPVRPCSVCGTPARGGRCGRHPHIRGQRTDAPKWRGAWVPLRDAVLRRDGHRCRYCGQRATTADHVIARLPVDYLLAVPALAVAACRPCNSSKGRLDLAYWAATGRAPAGAKTVLDELQQLINEAEQWLQQSA